MKLEQILHAQCVAVDVSASSKKRTLEEIAKLLASGNDHLAADAILVSLAGREKLGSTGLGHGVAIPHGRIAGITDSVGAFIRLRHPVDYDAHDGNPVDLVFGLVVPEQSTGEHLQHLAAIAEKLSDEAFCAQVRDAADASAVRALFSV